MIHRFFKDSLIYAGPNFIAAGLAFLFLPIYTRLLLPEEYGLVEMIILASSLLNIILSLEISQGYARLASDASDKTEKIHYASTSFWFIAAIFGFFLAVTVLFPGILGRLLLGQEYPLQLVIIAALIITVNALYYHVINQLRWNQQARSWAITRLLYVISYNSLAVLFLYAGYGLYGFLIGQMLGFCFALAGGIYACNRAIAIKLVFNTEKLKEMLLYSTPLVFSSIACYISLYTDRWMLNYFRGMEDVGIYSVAYKVSSIITLIIVGFQQSFVPLVYHNYKNADTPIRMADIFRYFIIIIFPLIALLSLLADDLLSLIAGEKYWAGSELIPLMTFAILLLNIYFFAPGMGLAKKTKKIALTNIIAASVNIILNFILIPVYGRFGAVFGTFGGGVVMASLYFYWSGKEYHIPYAWHRIFPLIIGLTILLLVVSKWSFPFTFRIVLWLICSIIVSLVLLNRSDLYKFKDFLNQSKSTA